MRRRTSRTEESESSDRWLVSYADFITLMFAFFTILYATSEQNAEKAKQFENSIRQYLIKFGAMGESGDKINQGVEQNSPIEQPLLIFKRAPEETIKTQKKIETFLQGNLQNKDLNKMLSDIDANSYGVKISLAADDLFEKGSTQMKSSALPFLDQVSRAVKLADKSIIIEGHSDISAQSNYPTPWELSSMQATKVLRYMTKVHSVDPKKVASMAFGNQRPIPEFNRRIDILILNEDLPF